MKLSDTKIVDLIGRAENAAGNHANVRATINDLIAVIKELADAEVKPPVVEKPPVEEKPEPKKAKAKAAKKKEDA